MPATQGASDHLEQTEETSGTRFLRTLGSVMADARRIDFAAAIEVRDLKRYPNMHSDIVLTDVRKQGSRKLDDLRYWAVQRREGRRYQEAIPRRRHILFRGRDVFVLTRSGDSVAQSARSRSKS